MSILLKKISVNETLKPTLLQSFSQPWTHISFIGGEFRSPDDQVAPKINSIKFFGDKSPHQYFHSSHDDSNTQLRLRTISILFTSHWIVVLLYSFQAWLHIRKHQSQSPAQSLVLYQDLWL